MKILTDTGLMVLWQRIKDLYKKISVSAKQTTTSTADGGTNVMTFTFGDGTSTTLSVKNGSKGSDGAKGEKGDRGPVGETGPQGNSGIADASNKALINDAVTGGETSYLSAEVGKLGILTYDCSKGGTVEHASLQDAINAVPTTFRKVGITIIYKSGDSIYRYALKSNSWSTDSTNWFSVEEKVSDLGLKIPVVSLFDYSNVTIGKSINPSNGAISDVIKSYKLVKLHLLAGNYWIYSAYGSSTQATLWKYSDNSYASPEKEIVGSTERTPYNQILTLEEGYYAFCWNDSNTNGVSLGKAFITDNLSVQTLINDTIEEVPIIAYNTGILNITSSDYTFFGYYSSTDGAFTKNQYRVLTPFITVSANDTISCFNSFQGSGQLVLIAFDKNKNILLDQSLRGKDVKNQTFNYKIPENVCYIRFGSFINYTETSICNAFARYLNNNYRNVLGSNPKNIDVSQFNLNIRLYLKDGVLVEESNNYRKSSAYIPVFAGQRLIRSSYDQTKEYNVVLYTSPSVEGFSRLIQNSDRSIIVVKDTEKYIRVCCQGDDERTLTITGNGYISNTSFNKNGTKRYEFDSLKNTTMSFNEFPNGLKKGHIFSLYGVVETFDNLEIGFGAWGNYKRHISIDNTNVNLIENDETVKTIKHGLNIKKYIKVICSSNDDGILNISLLTLEGNFETKLVEWGYKINGTPFVKVVGSLTNAIVVFGNKDFDKDIWCFGDSYYHVENTGCVMHWIKEYGLFSNILVMGYGGCTSQRAYEDFVRCLNFGTPKYLVWSEGMNDNFSTWTPYYHLIAKLCAGMNITLILNTIPSVRNTSYIEHDAITKLVQESGYRYIDEVKAVGGNSDGTWYGNGTSYDYQNTDNVHPSELGAKAIAAQWLIDFPEIEL